MDKQWEELLAREGISLRELAAKMGENPAKLSLTFSGKNTVFTKAIELVKKLSKATGRSEREIMTLAGFPMRDDAEALKRPRSSR